MKRVRPRVRDGRARARRPRRTTSPRRAGGGGGPWLYDRLVMPAGAAADPDPALDPARRAAAAAAVRLGAGEGGRSRRVPLPRRGADRPAPRPARARARPGADPARPLGRDRLPRLRGCGWRRHSWRSLPSSSIGRRSAANRVDIYFTKVRRTDPARRAPTATSTGSSPGSTPHDLERVEIEKQGTKFVQQHPRRRRRRSTRPRRSTSLEGAGALRRSSSSSARILVIVVSIYMLLDMPRLGRVARPALPAARRRARRCSQRIERGARRLREGPGAALADHRRERGARALHPRRRSGSVPGLENYALLFGAWVAFTELIPYLGPWLGAIPPLIYALVVHPISALWVALLFLGIHQIEGHVVVPKVMGSALRLHPAARDLRPARRASRSTGCLGVLVALPLLAVLRAMWEFFSAAVELEPWTGDGRCRSRSSSSSPSPPARSPTRRFPEPAGAVPDFACERLPGHAAAAAAPSGALRALVRETRLDLDDFVMPLFVGPTSAARTSELPGARPLHGRRPRRARSRSSSRLGVGAVILFGIPEEKDERGLRRLGRRRHRPAGAARAAARASPSSLLLTDVCLCEYTSHGHCGVIRDGEVDNDATLELLARTAVSHVEAGADAVCPSDMMDGRVGAIREALAASTPIVAYSAKYASAFYGPVPRGGRVGARVRRPARLPDGSAQRPRGAARVRARRRRGRRRADGQAGAAVPRRDPRRARALRRCRSPPTTSRASTRW